ncbi:MAG: hypothetical protein ABIM62_02620 [candidate division WOR-3 bacterium]
MKVLIFIFSIFYDYNFSPSLAKFETEGKAISLIHAPSICKFNKKNIYFSFSYSNPYSIPGLNFFEGAILKNIKNINIGIGYENFGIDFYKENIYLGGISFERERMNFGLNLKLCNLYIKQIISKWKISGDFGVSFFLLNNLKTGIFLLNLNSPKIFSERINSSTSLSFSFKENKEFETFFDINYEGEYVSFYLAQKFNILKNIQVIIGIVNEPPIFSFAFEIPFENINFSFSFKNHKILGGFTSYEVDITR